MRKIIAYLKLQGYDKSYINKIVFLMEWKYVLVNGERLFKEDWVLGNSGAENDINIDAIIATKIELDEEEKKYLNFILEKIEHMKYTDFVHMYFSVYPILTTDKYDKIDLVEAAKRYKIEFPEAKDSFTLKKGFFQRLFEKIPFK